VHEVGGHADGVTGGNSVVAILDRGVWAYSGQALGNAIREAED